MADAFTHSDYRSLTLVALVAALALIVGGLTVRAPNAPVPIPVPEVRITPVPTRPIPVPEAHVTPIPTRAIPAPTPTITVREPRP